MKISSMLKRINHHIFLSAAAILTAAVLALTAITMSLCYVISIDGTEVCSVRSRSALEELIASAEETASDILGYTYSFDGVITVSRSLRINTTLAADYENILLNYVDGISHLYLISVNGRTAGAQDSAADCLRLIDDAKAVCAGEDVLSCTVDSDVQIEYAYVRSDILQDAGEITALLDPTNSVSDVHLDVTTVELDSYVADVPYNTECVGSSALYVGESEIQTAGRDGEMRVTEYVTCKNGVPMGRETAGIEMISTPVTELVAIGTASGVRTDSTGVLIWPCSGILTSYFGPRSGGVGSTNHKGIDICGAYAQDILAADGGEVIFAGWMSGYGNFIQIRHDDGTVTCYGHMCELAACVGERVAQGQVIGYMGDTGTASAVHLHFEVRVDGTQVDPLTFLP